MGMLCMISTRSSFKLHWRYDTFLPWYKLISHNSCYIMFIGKTICSIENTTSSTYVTPCRVIRNPNCVKYYYIYIHTHSVLVIFTQLKKQNVIMIFYNQPIWPGRVCTVSLCYFLFSFFDGKFLLFYYHYCFFKLPVIIL